MELEKERSPGTKFTISWLPFLLRPDMPADGRPKAPDTPDNPRVGQWLKRASGAVGLDFTGKTDRYPNSLKSHALLSYALQTKGADVQNELQELLFKGYYTDGIYPDDDNLVMFAKKVGFIEEDVRKLLHDNQAVNDVRKEAQQLSRSGINGVPYFFINDQGAFSGAQDPQAFLKAFKQLA